MNKIRLTQKLMLGAAVAALVTVTGCATTPEKKVDDGPKDVVADKPKDVKPPAKVDSTAALVADGTKLLKDGRATDAKAKFDQVLKKEPGNVDAKVGMAQAQLKLGEFDGAKAILTDLQKTQPDSREVVLLLGLLHKAQGNYDAGIGLYEKEIE